MKATIRWPACRPISIDFAIWPCAARPISRITRSAATREKEEAIKYANNSLLERLVAIVDNFELGLEAARAEGENRPIFSGMSLVLKQLKDFRRRKGLAADRGGRDRNSIRTCTKRSPTNQATKFPRER